MVFESGSKNPSNRRGKKNKPYRERVLKYLDRAEFYEFKLRYKAVKAMHDIFMKLSDEKRYQIALKLIGPGSGMIKFTEKEVEETKRANVDEIRKAVNVKISEEPKPILMEGGEVDLIDIPEEKDSWERVGNSISVRGVK